MIVCRLAYWSVLLLRQTCLARVQINENMGSHYEFATLTFQSPRRPWITFHASALRTRTDKQIEDFLLFSTGGEKKKIPFQVCVQEIEMFYYTGTTSAFVKQTLILIVANKLKHRPLVAGSMEASFKQLTGGPRVKSKGSIRIWITFTQKRLPVIWAISYHMDVRFSLLCLQWLSQCLDRSPRGRRCSAAPVTLTSLTQRQYGGAPLCLTTLFAWQGPLIHRLPILFFFFKFVKKFKKNSQFSSLTNEKAKKATTK